MCINPIKIKNKSFVITSNEPLFYEVPCGKCYQCQLTEKNSWAFRSHIEMQQCLSNGGFVYFDTLTYAPAYLPSLKLYFEDIPNYLDFPCFSRRDLQLFFKRLRKNISSRYGLKKDVFKYFVSSEYGTDERYTHRPHYHIIFFVNSPIISPVDFSYLVSDSWQLGRTDGGCYQTNHYIINHNTLTASTPEVNRLRVIYYVSKYIQKDSYFQKEINSRLTRVARFYSCDLREDFQTFFNSAKRYIGQFHLQSIGFGSSYSVDWDEYLMNGFILMPLYNDIPKKIPLPNYYLRKSLYEIVYLGGKKLWSLTRFGKKVKNNLKHKARQQFPKKILSIVFNQLFITNCANIQKRAQKEYIKKPFLKHLTDYCFELRYYRSADGYNHSLSLSDKLKYPHLYNYSNKEDIKHFGGSYLSPRYYGDDKLGYDLHLDHFQKHNRISHDAFVDAIGLIEHNHYFGSCYTDSFFENFLGHWKDTNYEIEQIRQQEYDEKLRLQKLYKASCLSR